MICTALVCITHAISTCSVHSACLHSQAISHEYLATAVHSSNTSGTSHNYCDNMYTSTTKERGKIMSNEQSSKRKLSKTIGNIIFVVILIAVVWYVYDIYVSTDDDDSTSSSSRITLDTPVVTYNQATCTYSWADVDGADYYSVDVNGSVTEVYDSQYFLVPTAETTIVTIQACADDGLKYKDSDWSETITVYTDLSTVSLSSVLAAVNDLTSKYVCTKIINVYSSGNKLIFNTLGTTANGTWQLITYEVYSKTGEAIESMEQFLELSENSQRRFTYDYQDYVEYSSLESFIKSGQATTIQSYLDQGYTCTVVSEAGVLLTDTILQIYGTVCLDNGKDTTYLTVNYNVYLNKENSTYEEEYRFTTLFEDAANFFLIEENRATVLEGDFTDIFEEMLAIKLALAE